MRKKKSYMNKQNVLSEGFFDKVKKFFGLSKQEESGLKRNKKLRKSLRDLNKEVIDLEKDIQKHFDELGIKQKFNAGKFSIKDFTK
jgi:16S rRNA A1518/A1519 N6-dimethyltransferase RsmA/KsgA/DIM1 with predicted DNA glycosylase/AP lyase activity